jgi:hypothetical protein
MPLIREGDDLFHYHPPRPPSQLLLRQASPKGMSIGLETDISAIKTTGDTNMSLREVKGFYCYLFSWYLTNGRFPEPDDFFEIFYSYVEGRVLPKTPPQRLAGTINLFREAIVEAQSSGEAAANTANAMACTIP